MTSSVAAPPEVETERDLLVLELGRLLTIEETLAKVVLPELLLELQDDDLKQAVEGHLGETRQHVENVKEAFRALDETPAGRPAYGLDGLRTEHKATVPNVAAALRPSIHCSAAMGMEHYEINAYEPAIRLAGALGEGEVDRLLRKNLDQEVAALEKLGKQADRLA